MWKTKREKRYRKGEEGEGGKEERRFHPSWKNHQRKEKWKGDKGGIREGGKGEGGEGEGGEGDGGEKGGEGGLTLAGSRPCPLLAK